MESDSQRDKNVNIKSEKLKKLKNGIDNSQLSLVKIQKTSRI